ncbi:MAG: cation diffusion facilitator family transporter, partial [archaeon]|nr:cation diffusion facilitator family transporter [archaeon]
MEQQQSCCERNKRKISEVLTTLGKKKNLKNLAFFLVLNLGFMFVEVIYGLISNSLGLLTDGAHMCLDCTGVLIGLISAYLSDFPSNSTYNFGYARSELIGTFVNSVFLFFMAIYIVFESVERFISPKEIEGDSLILVSFLGLLVNLVGIYFFHDINEDEDHHHHHHHDHHHEELETEHKDMSSVEIKNKEETHEHHDHHHEEEEEGPKNENLYAIYIHILADTLGSVAVLISSFLIRYFNFFIADPICSLSISFMILYTSTPVLKRATLALLHYQDEKIMKIKKKIETAIMNIKLEEGASLSIGHFDIWVLKKGYYIAEMKVNLNCKEVKRIKETKTEPSSELIEEENKKEEIKEEL